MTSCVCMSDDAAFLMLLASGQIVGLDLDSSPATDGFSTSVVPVIGITNGNDFDYDSRDGVIYWVEYSERNQKVQCSCVCTRTLSAASSNSSSQDNQSLSCSQLKLFATKQPIYGIPCLLFMNVCWLVCRARS